MQKVCLEIFQVCWYWFLLQWNYSTRAYYITANFHSFLLRSQHNNYILKRNKKQYEILFLLFPFFRSGLAVRGIFKWFYLVSACKACSERGLRAAKLSRWWRKFLFSVLRWLLLSIHLILVIIPFHSNINKIAVHSFIHVMNVF